MTDILRTIHAASDCLAGRLEGRQPEVGIVLGSGLGKLADDIQDPLVIPYSEIPGFPVSTAIGHKGNFIVGPPAGRPASATSRRSSVPSRASTWPDSSRRTARGGRTTR